MEAVLMQNVSQHRVQKQMQSFIRFVIGSGLLAMTIGFLFIMGPIAEAKFLPVTSNIAIQFVRTQEGYGVFTATGTRERSCTLLNVRAVGRKDSNDSWQRVGIWLLELQEIEPTPGVLGRHNLGFYGVSPMMNEIHVDASFDCHRFWTTETIIGTWNKP